MASRTESRAKKAIEELLEELHEGGVKVKEVGVGAAGISTGGSQSTGVGKAQLGLEGLVNLINRKFYA